MTALGVLIAGLAGLFLFCGRAQAKGGGKGGSMPDVKETPKQQTTKPVTEAATAARETQRDKARKAAGISGSILTSPLDAQSGATGQKKTLLGQ